MTIFHKKKALLYIQTPSQMQSHEIYPPNDNFNPNHQNITDNNTPGPSSTMHHQDLSQYANAESNQNEAGESGYI